MKSYSQAFRALVFLALGTYVLFFSKAYFDMAPIVRWILGIALVVYGGYKVYLIIASRPDNP